MKETYPLQWPEGWPRTRPQDRKMCRCRQCVKKPCRAKGFRAPAGSVYSAMRRIGSIARKKGLPRAISSSKEK